MRWVWEKGMSFSCCLCLYLPRRRWHPPNYFASVNMEAVEIVSPCSTARILSQTSVNIILRLFLPFWAVHCFGLSPMDLLVFRISIFLCLLTRDDAVCLKVSGGSLLMTITFIITAINGPANYKAGRVNISRWGDAGGRCGAVGEKGDSGDCASNRKWPLHFYQLAWKICNLFPNICILYITHNIYCHERYPAYKSGSVRK